MSTSSTSVSPAKQTSKSEVPTKIYLVPLPKIAFLYPSLIMGLVAAFYMTFATASLDQPSTGMKVVSILFLVTLATNLVVLAFDFPRTTSLTLFFFLVALVTGGVLIHVLEPTWFPFLSEQFAKFHPIANATFYWTYTGIMGLLYLVSLIMVQFDYWEVRPNELLHHHGFLSNLERFASPSLKIDKEINDVFEYLLLHSGRLILQPSNERRAI